jgi:hypothetical protein
MSVKFVYATHSNGLLGERRGYVEIKELREGQELTPDEAIVVLLDRIDSILERIADNTR